MKASTDGFSHVLLGGCGDGEVNQHVGRSRRQRSNSGACHDTVMNLDRADHGVDGRREDQIFGILDRSDDILAHATGRTDDSNAYHARTLSVRRRLPPTTSTMMTNPRSAIARAESSSPVDSPGAS